jgi:hypothetical protein
MNGRQSIIRIQRLRPFRGAPSGENLAFGDLYDCVEVDLEAGERKHLHNVDAYRVLFGVLSICSNWSAPWNWASIEVGDGVEWFFGKKVGFATIASGSVFVVNPESEIDESSYFAQAGGDELLWVLLDLSVQLNHCLMDHGFKSVGDYLRILSVPSVRVF